MHQERGTMQSALAQQVALFEDAPDRSEPRSIFFERGECFCRVVPWHRGECNGNPTDPSG